MRVLCGVSTKVKTVVSNHSVNDGFLSTSPKNSLRKYGERVACFNQMASSSDSQVLQCNILRY